MSACAVVYSFHRSTVLIFITKPVIIVLVGICYYLQKEMKKLISNINIFSELNVTCDQGCSDVWREKIIESEKITSVYSLSHS